MNTTGHVIVSGYTKAPYGAGPGVVRFSLEPGGAVGEHTGHGTGAVNPSFMVAGGGGLLAVEEQADGRIAALDPETLDVIARAPSGGGDPCHLMLLDGDIWAANYASGTASVTPLASLRGGATPVPPVLVSHPGSGPVAERQDASHAHQVTATPWGTVLVSDLGADRVDEYSAGSRVRLGSAELPPGTGPRHVAIKGQCLLVAGELDGHVHLLRRTALDPAGGEGHGHFWRWLSKVPLAPTAQDVADAAEFFPSHLQLSGDGTRLYAAVRGPNTLVVLDVSGLEQGLAPVFLARISSGGAWPRHFAVGGHMMYVANQRSNSVTVFALDRDGLPGPEPVQTLDFGSPTCVLLP